MTKPRVLLCSLTHNGLIHFEMAGRFFVQASAKWDCECLIMPSSLLAHTCNHFWCKAINDRVEKNYHWFAMLHADIIPEPLFIDKLIDLATQHGADIMSAIVPLKGPEGVTSTAISGPNEFTRATRLTMAQVNSQRFPDTFDITGALEGLERLGQRPKVPDPHPPFNLLVNTGCFVARLDQPWTAHAYFEIRNRISTDVLGAKYFAQVESEDWFFSRIAAEHGAKVMATRLVTTRHVGHSEYRSDQVWGNPIDKTGFMI